ncbi:MAG: FecR domain-containing protein [Deltaproteobacteria bacterium]|nr:FecR domain-containing protein [Deltaproteobacteria bacterium]MBT7715551.1 FecR domain-containing protein [Deltaproteobacteria bacterium]MBT7891642.1 FecR domain-containing protein [Deltaproteobacteria bacterium]
MSHKIRFNTLWLIPVLLVMFVTTASGFPFSSDVVIGKIVPLAGLVVVKRKSKGMTVKPPAMIIYRGDNVLTNETGKARILLTGGNEVFVGPSSTLYLNKSFQSRYNYKYSLNLKGKLRAKIQRVRGRRFRIKTSTAVIDVKGTDFIVDTTTASTTQVATFTGLVQLTSLKTKQKVDIPSGQMSSITKVGKVSKPKKVEIEVVKDLEDTGKTGIKELDTIMKPPPPLDPTIKMDIEVEPPQKLPPKQVAQAEIQPERSVPEPILADKEEEEIEPEKPVSMWFYAEEYRKSNRWGFGVAPSLSPYVGGVLGLDFNLTARSQLHLQYSQGAYDETAESTSSAENQLQRKLSAISFRYFLSDSGIYFGAGAGSSQFEQQFNNNPGVVTISGSGSFVMGEIGIQAYGTAFSSTFFISMGTQYLSYTSFKDDYLSGSIAAADYEKFKRRAKNSQDGILLGIGWFF